MSTDLSAYWAAAGMSGPVPEPSAFGDTAAQQDELCALILAGVKRGTTSLARWYDAPEAPLPRVGDRRLIVDGRGAPRGIVETVSVEIMPFDQVGEAFARIEGEGDGSLAYWRNEHRRYFEAEQAAEGLGFSDDEIVVCESFRLVYPRSPD